MDDNNLNNMNTNQDHDVSKEAAKKKADSNTGFYAKNIAFIVAGTSGAIYGVTLLPNGFMYAGAGIVLILTGAYLAVHGVKSVLSKRAEKLNKISKGSDNKDNKGNPNPKWDKPKKKKKKKKK